MKIFLVILGACIHTAIFNLVGLTILFAIEGLIDGGGLSSTPGVWMRYLANLGDSIQSARRLPFALCVLANAVVLPAAFGAWATSACLKGHRLRPGMVACRAFLYAIVGYAGFIVALIAALAAAPFRIGTMASYGLVWYAMLIFLWDLLFIPLAVFSHHLIAFSALRLTRFKFGR